MKCRERTVPFFGGTSTRYFLVLYVRVWKEGKKPDRLEKSSRERVDVSITARTKRSPTPATPSWGAAQGATGVLHVSPPQEVLAVLVGISNHLQRENLSGRPW